MEDLSDSGSRVCVDLCRGLGGFSQAFVDAGWKVIGVDIEPKFNPTVCADITKIDWLEFKRDFLEDKSPDVLLASPPCERFSVACPEWPKKGVKKALEIVGACLEAVVFLKPKRWLIENPKGRLRWFIGTPRQTIKYSHYDMSYKGVKNTDFWGNIPFPMVKNARVNKIGHYEKHWFHSYMGSNRAKIAEIPLGVSEAVLESVSISDC